MQSTHWETKQVQVQEQNAIKSKKIFWFNQPSRSKEMSYKTNKLQAPRVGQFDLKRLFQRKIEQCSSIIPLQSRKIVVEPKIVALAYLIFSIVL